MEILSTVQLGSEIVVHREGSVHLYVFSDQSARDDTNIINACKAWNKKRIIDVYLNMYVSAY